MCHLGELSFSQLSLIMRMRHKDKPLSRVELLMYGSSHFSALTSPARHPASASSFVHFVYKCVDNLIAKKRVDYDTYPFKEFLYLIVALVNCWIFPLTLIRTCCNAKLFLNGLEFVHLLFVLRLSVVGSFDHLFKFKGEVLAECRIHVCCRQS